MKKIKLIALDLDGTLLQNNSEISSANRYWIREAEKSGLLVVLATGRGRSTSQQYWDVVAPQAPMIMVNGAEVWRNHHSLLARYFLPSEDVHRLRRLALQFGVRYWGHSGQGLVVQEQWPQQPSAEQKWLKFGLSSPDGELLAEVGQKIISWNRLEVTSSAPNNLEIAQKGVSKASALAQVARLLKIEPGEVAAVGDGLNDLEMIKWAGFGVAMANAHPALHAAADYVAGSNEKDGVARLIQLILK